MDIQFKNIKAHARGESKRTWYEWRSKLFDGLNEGLQGIRQGMIEDDKVIAQQEQLLQSIVPSLAEKHAQLKEEASILQARADEVASCDQNELQRARERLVQTEQEIQAKLALIANLKAEMEQKDETTSQITERLSDCRAEIHEAERVTSENRGWTSTEVKALKGTSPSYLHSCPLTNHF